jgi:hypothetical protein
MYIVAIALRPALSSTNHVYKKRNSDLNDEAIPEIGGRAAPLVNIVQQRYDDAPAQEH